MLGKLYLVPPDGLDAIPGWTEMGPDADDPELTLERSASGSGGIPAS